MKTMIKKLCYGLFAILTVLCFALAGINLVGAEEASAAKITMNAGAAIRKADADYGTGLRFFAELSKADYDALVAADTDDKLEFGIILTVKDFYDKDNSFAIGSGEWKEFVVGGENNPTDMYYLRGKCSPRLDTDDADNDGDTSEMLFMFSITDVLDSNLARKFVAKAYYTTDGESFVYSEAVAQRSIFEVATRAYANEDYKDEVAPIIDKVCEAYPNVSFSVADAETEKKVGDKLAITATLSDGNGNAVEAYATATAAKDGMLTENADGTYTINRLGDFTITAALGFDSVKLGETKTQEIEIKNADTRKIDVATEMYTEKTSKDEPTVKTEELTSVDTDYYYESIYKFDVTEDSANVANHLIRFNNDTMKEVYAGDYLLFDVYKAAAIKFAFSSTSVDGVEGVFYTYAGPTSNGNLVNSKMYLSGVDGVSDEVPVATQGLSSGYYLNAWHTVAIKFEDKPASMSLKITTNGGSAVVGYLKNFRIASEVKAATTIMERAILSSDFIVNGETNQKETVNYADRVALKYTATAAGLTGSLALESTSGSVGGNEVITKWLNGKGVKFISFDIYFDKDIDFSFRAQSSSTTATTTYSHYVVNLSDTSVKSNDMYDVAMSVNGEEINSLNGHAGQWVTVRLTLKATVYAIPRSNTLYASAFYFNTVSESATVYFSNMFLGKNA